MFLDSTNFSCANISVPVTVTLTVVDISGNIASDTAIVTVLDTISPMIVCQSDTVVMNDSGQCGAIVNYPLPFASDNCTIDTIIQTDGSGLFSGSEFPIGTTLVEFTAYDVNGNSSVCTFNVTVLDTQAPTIVCVADTLICDSVFTFDPPATTDNCSADSILQIAGINSGGVYPLGATINTFVAFDPSGNSDTCSFTVTRDAFPTSADAGLDTALCNLTAYTLNGNVPTIGAGAWTVLSSAATIADPANPSTTVTGLNIGDNTFVWTVGFSVCVSLSDTVNVMVDELPTVSSLAQNLSLCEEEQLEITANSPTVGTGRWTISGPADLSDSLSDKVTLLNMGVGQIDVTWTISNGVCPESSDEMTVFNNLNPTVYIGEDFARFAGFEVAMNPSTTNTSSFLWSPPAAFDDPTIETPVAKVSETTTLALLVTSDSGCTASDSVDYVVTFISDIPTGITPNGDNINDVWNIDGLNQYPNAKIIVYDQAGRVVFESTGYDTPWDGKFNGKLLPRASYYWIIDLKDGINEPLQGIISIIR
ncbi:MAG: gliding motility-associated C-terminal domain-containing protein [Flavobacteriales bacterium]